MSKQIITKSIYDNIRSKYTTLSKYWNGIMRVWKDVTNPQMPYTQSGSKTVMNEKVPNKYKYSQYKNYEGLGYTNDLIQTNSNPQIYESKNTIDIESTKIHTLGNENNIRRSLKSLNNIVHTYIGASAGFSKIEINEIGSSINVPNWISNHLYSKNDKVKVNNNVYICIENHTSLDFFDQTKFQIILKNDLSTPSQNSFVEYSELSDPQSLKQNNVCTYDNNTFSKLNNDNIIKKSDYEVVEKVLNRIQQCLNKKSNWFSSGLCARQCQVSCQKTCQLVCQGCNTKQCHNQKCGMH